MKMLSSFVGKADGHWRYKAMGIMSLVMLSQSNMPCELTSLDQDTLQTTLMESLAWVRNVAIGYVTAHAQISPSQTPNTNADITLASLTSLTTPTGNEYDGFGFIDNGWVGWNGAATSTNYPLRPETSSANKPLTPSPILLRSLTWLVERPQLEQLLTRLEEQYVFTKSGDNGRGLSGVNLLKSSMSNLFHMTASFESVSFASNSSRGGVELTYFWMAIFDMVDGACEACRELLLEKAMSTSRASQCVVIEIFIGLVLASNKTDYARSVVMCKLAQDVITRALHAKFESPQSLNDWQFALRYAAQDRDPRRCSFIPQELDSIEFDPNQSSTSLIKKLSFIEAYLIGTSWRSYPKALALLKSVSDANILGHDYKRVRQQIASIISKVFELGRSYQQQGKWKLTIDSTLQSYVQQFKQILQNYIVLKVADNDTIAHACETILEWMVLSISISSPMVHYLPQLLPIILKLHVALHEDVRNLARAVLALASQILYTKKDIHDIIYSQIQVVADHPAWRVRVALLPFLQILTFNHACVMSKQDVEHILVFVSQSLVDVQVEVRNVAKTCLSSIIKSTAWTVDKLVDGFKLQALPLSKKQMKLLNAKDAKLAIAKRHGAVLGLIAIAESCPYSLPKWLPSIMEEIASHRNAPNPINEAVAEALRSFNRTHQDQWVEVKQLFSYEQVQAIKQSNSASYLA